MNPLPLDLKIGKVADSVYLMKKRRILYSNILRHTTTSGSVQNNPNLINKVQTEPAIVENFSYISNPLISVTDETSKDPVNSQKVPYTAKPLTFFSQATPDEVLLDEENTFTDPNKWKNISQTDLAKPTKNMTDRIYSGKSCY